MLYSVEELRHIVSPIAKQYGVKSVAVFGSYSRGQASETSDMDLKIEKGTVKTLYQLSSFRLALEDALGVSVDLVTSESSDTAFLDMIAKDEVLLYQSLE